MTTTILSRPTIAAGQLIGRGVSWWLSELAQMAPRRLLRLLGKPGEPTSVLHVGASEVVLFVSDRRRPSPVMIPLTGYGDEERRLRVSAAMHNHRTDEAVTVRLDRALVFETSIELPLSAERSLRPILQHQIERLVPLGAAEACFEYRIAARAPAATALRVHLVIAKAATIDRVLALSRAAGLSPKLVIAPAADGPPGDGRGETPLVLWQAGSGRKGTAGERRLHRGLEIAAVVLLLAAYGFHVHRLDRSRDELQAQIARAKPASAIVQELARQVEQTNEAVAFFRQRRSQAAPLKILDELTRLVPEESWVARLVVRGRNVEIDGYAPRATDLISRVESSAMFGNPLFRSPITLSPDGKSEHFDLSLDVRSEPAP